MAELPSVRSLIAASRSSRVTLPPLGNFGSALNANSVTVYTFSPGPLEQGGAYSA